MCAGRKVARGVVYKEGINGIVNLPRRAFSVRACQIYKLVSS